MLLLGSQGPGSAGRIAGALSHDTPLLVSKLCTYTRSAGLFRHRRLTVSPCASKAFIPTPPQSPILPFFFPFCLNWSRSCGKEGNQCYLFGVSGFGALCEKHIYCTVKSLQFAECFLSLSLFLSLYFMCIHTLVLHTRGATCFLSKPLTILKLKRTFWSSSSEFWRSVLAEPMLLLGRMGLKCHPGRGMLQQELAGVLRSLKASEAKERQTRSKKEKGLMDPSLWQNPHIQLQKPWRDQHYFWGEILSRECRYMRVQTPKWSGKHWLFSSWRLLFIQPCSWAHI